MGGMKQWGLIGIAASGWWLLPVACDAPQEASNTTAMLNKRQNNNAAANTTKQAPLRDENAFFEEIMQLLSAPQRAPGYAQEVKRLSQRYLEQCYSSPEHRDAVIRGYIRTLTQQAERFSGNDFDEALRYSRETIAHGDAPDATALQYAIRMADYRIDAVAKTALLQEMDTHAQAAEQAGNKSRALHLLYLLAAYAPHRQNAYAERYYRQADYAGAPHRIEMLVYAANMPTAQQICILTQESAAPSAEDQPALRAAIRTLIAARPAEQLQALFTHPNTAYIALTELLLQQMDATEPDIAALRNTARRLQEASPSPAPPFTDLALALYKSRYGDGSATTCMQAEAGFRRLITDGSPCRTQAELGLAALLLTPAHTTPQRKQEARSIYQKLAQNNTPATAAQALEQLLQLYLEEKQYPEANNTCIRLLKLSHSSTDRIHILQTIAEIAEIRHDIESAISTYGQIEAESLGKPAIGAPACLRMMQLLLQRNHAAGTDTEKATYTPSDKWYAWKRGKMFLGTINTPPEDALNIPAIQEIRNLTQQLNLDYDIRAEEQSIKSITE